MGNTTVPALRLGDAAGGATMPTALCGNYGTFGTFRNTGTVLAASSGGNISSSTAVLRDLRRTPAAVGTAVRGFSGIRRWFLRGAARQAT